MPIEIHTDRDNAHAPRDPSERSWSDALMRGFKRRCPSCGDGAIFDGFLRVNPVCSTCGTELHHHRADDAPPYMTIFIVGHVILAGLLALEQAYAPPTWLHLLIWMPLAVVGCAWLLPRIKGALIGLQWAHRMHGFGNPDDPDDIELIRKAQG